MVQKTSLVLLMVVFVLLAGSVNAYMGGSMGSNGQSGGDQSKGSSGQGNGGPRWEGTGSQRPLSRGFSFNCNGSGPEVAVVDNASRGISMGLSLVEFDGKDHHYSIDVEEHTWEVDNGSGLYDQINRTYTLEHVWSPEGPVANLTISFSLDWKEGVRMIRFRSRIDRLPGEGTLRLTYMFRTESASSWGSSSWQPGNGGLSLRDQNGDDVCEVDHRSVFTYKVQGVDTTSLLKVNGTVTQDGGVLVTEGTVRSDITSAELEGSMTLLDTFFSAIEEVVEEGVDYVRDHLVSFLIGGALTIAISALMVLVVVLKRKDGADGLVLERNRYYIGPKGHGR